jgi:hypothetical protein
MRFNDAIRTFLNIWTLKSVGPTPQTNVPVTLIMFVFELSPGGLLFFSCCTLCSRALNLFIYFEPGRNLKYFYCIKPGEGTTSTTTTLLPKVMPRFENWDYRSPLCAGAATYTVDTIYEWSIMLTASSLYLQDLCEALFLEKHWF